MKTSNEIDILKKTTALIENYLESVHKRERKVVNFHDPEKLKHSFDFSLGKNSASQEEILQDMQRIADLSVANQHPRFFSALR